MSDKELNDNENAADDALDANEADDGDHQLAALQEQLEEANSKALYAAAELQNARRRMEKELADTRNYATTGFARDMLSVRDHLQRGLDHLPEGSREGNLKGFVEGIESTLRELDSVFAKNGIEKIAAKGLPLDPNFHQAMIEIPNGEVEPGTVIEEMQAGYKIKDRLLRPALVGVAKAP